MEAQPLSRGLDEIFCPACGEAIKREAVICIRCGVPVGYQTETREGKDKTVAVILAIFLGFWTWLYTYKHDAWKFWLGVSGGIANLLLTVVTAGVWGVVAIIWGLGISVWAIVEAVRRPRQFYQLYPLEFEPVSGVQSTAAIPAPDPERPESIRLNQLLTMLAEVNRKIDRNARPSFLTAWFWPLLSGIGLGMVVAVIFTSIGAAFSGGASEPPDWWMGFVMMPSWLGSTALLVHHFRSRAYQKNADEVRDLREQVDQAVSQVDSEFPDFVRRYGGSDALSEFRG